MEQMLDGNSAAELEYNGVNWRDPEHREAVRQIRRDRQEFINTLLKNEPATTLYKRGCVFTLRDAIDSAIANHVEFAEHIVEYPYTVFDAHCMHEDEDYIAKLFMECKLPNNLIRLIGSHVELIANEIFVGWDDE